MAMLDHLQSYVVCDRCKYGETVPVSFSVEEAIGRALLMGCEKHIERVFVAILPERPYPHCRPGGCEYCGDVESWAGNEEA